MCFSQQKSSKHIKNYCHGTISSIKEKHLSLDDNLSNLNVWVIQKELMGINLYILLFVFTHPIDNNIFPTTKNTLL